MNKPIAIIGIVFLLISVFAYFYSVTEKESYLGGLITDTDTEFPFRNYSFVLFIGGLILLIVGIFLNKKGGNKNGSS